MKKIKDNIFLLIFTLAAIVSCRDESLYPLPYDTEKDNGGYLRIIQQTSNVVDLNDLANSAFEATFEAVEKLNGDNVEGIEFWASHRRGTGLTDEVLVTTIDGTGFAPTPQPTISIFKRAKVRVLANDILAKIQTLTTDPDGTCTTLSNICSPSTGLVAYPGGPLLAGDVIILRWILILKDGRRFSVINPQAAVNPSMAKTLEANSTPNVTTAQFASSPFTAQLTVRSVPAGSWIGDYSLTQEAIWSALHTWNQHEFYPAGLNQVLFPNQTVTLATVPGGLSTERQFSVNYRGKQVTMKINLENGTVFVPLQNSGVECAPQKSVFWVTPTTGNFTLNSFGPLAPGLPQATTANRGAYTAASTGTTPGNTLRIGLDDDADEYGLRNGYCTWTRRVKLLLTKL
ncbi:MAG TPA: hypothetical protein DIS90_08900 [Cytophagales bacterium]|nr:hypothetical protein [Cytophagales bacterium]